MLRHFKNLKSVCILAAVFCFAIPPAESGSVRNGSFVSRGGTMTPEKVKKYREKGLTCPDAKEWPDCWAYAGYGDKGATFEFPRTGGVRADGFARISGKGRIAGYYGLALEDRNYIYTVWARGKGTLQLRVISYGKDEAGNPIQLTKKDGGVAGREFKVDSKVWVCYRHVLKKSPALWNVHPRAFAEEGTLDIDEVNIEPACPALDLIVQEEEKLYGTGALIENIKVIQADKAFAKRQGEYRTALKDYRAASTKLDKDLLDSMEKRVAFLDPYVFTKGLSSIQVPCYNEMIALTRVLKRLAGEELEEPAPVKAKKVKVTSAAGYEAGVRKARPGTVTITEIKRNLRLYKENDDAGFKATIVNASKTTRKGTLIALMHLDLDTVREIRRQDVTIAARGTKVWTVNYNVGPETYGRGIEVRFEDENGQVIDSWREFYHVAGEWFRVQMHTSRSRYANIRHYHGGEPTDFGVHSTDAEQYISGICGYRVNVKGRRNSTAGYKKRTGEKFTFYQQIGSFCGIMGYEEIRKHPEYVLYDENGQFAVDPVYGGCPNPVELASPIEIGPKRAPRKPYLDRMYTPWQHCPANFADPEVAEYGAKCMKKYARENNFDGVYLDGAPFVMKGYKYDGRVNIPSDKKEMARLNALVANTYQRILKEENPCFGTWFNHGYRYVAHHRRLGRVEHTLGSGLDTPGVDDVGDEAVRALTGWKNVSCLEERQGTFRGGEGLDCYPHKLLAMLLDNRDYLVQKYEANVIIGYIGIPIDRKEPGPSKWGWPTINYFMAVINATQHHIVTWGMPSFEPAFQFVTRYSRFLWAPDIKAVPVDVVEKTVELISPEKLWWKRLVYKRKTKEGYDLIIHLVRIPPTEKWDINWIDEPVPLEGVEITVDVTNGKLKTAQAMRPYQFEEEQQPVRKMLKPKTDGGKTTVTIPSFRYHTMVVFRVTETE